jgi:hypothetical protein
MVVNLKYIDLKMNVEKLILPGGGGAKNGYEKC